MQSEPVTPSTRSGLRLSVDPSRCADPVESMGNSLAAVTDADCQVFRANPPYCVTSVMTPMSVGSGRQNEHDTTPGSSRSSPSKNCTSSSRLRVLIGGAPLALYCAMDVLIASAWTSAVGWDIAR